MKKVVLILMVVVMCVTAQAGWFSKTKPEIKVEQIWRSVFCGTEVKILQTGEYIVFKYANGTYDKPDVKSKEEFYNGYKLLEDIDIIDINITVDGSEISFYISEPKKHKVRFQGYVMIGGDVELEWDDSTFMAESTAFDNWFGNLTIKEIRESWGFDVVNRMEIEGENK